MLKKALEHLIAIEFIVYSGGVKSFMSSQRDAMIVMLVTAFVWFIINKEKKKDIFSYNIKLYGFIFIWVFINVFFINTDIRDKTYLTYLLIPLACCICISLLSFQRFRTLFFLYLTILSAISIVVQLLHDYGGIGATEITINNVVYHFSYGIFNTEWGTHRLSSIYWEPGQYQVVLIFTLCLFVDELRDISRLQVNVRKFFILILALIMTYSTTGYLALMILFFSIFAFPKNSKHSWKIILSIGLGFCLAYLIFMSNAVQNKINKESQGDEISYNVRLADNLGCLRLALDYPFAGAGISTRTASKKLLQYDSMTSSNGWLFVAASFGMIYPIILLLALFLGIKRMKLGTPTILIWVTLVLSQANEGFTMLPYMWMFIFKYKSYSNNILASNEKRQ